MGSTYSRFYPPAPTWSVDQIPDLTGKVILVTGGNTGIGKETCKALLAKNAKVYLAARTVSKATEAIDQLKAATGKTAIFLQLDLANLASIRKSAEEFLSKEDSLHVLFCSAGVMVPPVEQTTADGYDLQFGTNVVGHFFLIKLLLPTLIATKQRTGEPSRVIISSSSVQSFQKGPIKYDTFKDGPARRKQGAWALYSQSKYADIMVSNELSKRYSDQGIVSVSLDPGNIKSDLQRSMPAVARWIMNSILLYPTPMGAISQLYAGTMPEGVALNGKFLVPWARVGTPQPGTEDAAECEKLWNWLEEQVVGK